MRGSLIDSFASMLSIVSRNPLRDTVYKILVNYLEEFDRFLQQFEMK